MKPTDFLMGVREFFIRFVPGALFLWLFPPTAQLVAALGEKTLGLLVFAIIAYLLGSVADDVGGFMDRAVDGLAGHRRFRRLFARDLDQREARARVLRDRLLHRAGVPPVMDPDESPKMFWWDFLRLSCPAALAELDRIEAVQKMFWSLVGVFLVIGIYGAGGRIDVPGVPAVAATAFIGLAALCLPFYIGWRVTFLSAVCRLAAAWEVSRELKATPR